MKKVSIIIPAYNAEKTINRCLDSILEQNYDNFEIILLNDGSKDNTEKLINRYTDNRIIYIKKENTGIGDTRNRGIDIATGEYILFLDSDDYLEPDCISNAVNKIEENNSDLIVFDC